MRVPENSRLFKPVIVHTVGHEGSSGLMRILQLFGLFLGTDLSAGKKKAFYESKMIQEINREILKAKGFPYPWHLENRQETLAPYLKNTQYIAEIRKKIAQGIVEQGYDQDSNIPWGWKDPRTALTLPFWIRVFPECKVIFLKRNPKDTRPGWNAKGDWGYDYYRKYRHQDMIDLSLETEISTFVVHYDTLSYDFSKTCNRLADFIGTNITKEDIETARALWKPKYNGTIQEVLG